MFALAKWLRSTFTPTAARRQRRAALAVESLEDRWVPANLDLTQVALAHGVIHNNPTHLYLNFDGGIGKVGAYTNGASTDKDIQDILYRTSEIFAPFNVEVTRLTGAGNYYQG